MTHLQDLLERAVGSGTVPGAAALVARGDEVEAGSAGEVGEDSIARIASISKPITAAALMLLVDEGLVALDDPIARWLPELASPQVVRTPRQLDRRRRAGRPPNHGRGCPDLPRRLGLPVRLLAARGGRALPEVPSVRAPAGHPTSGLLSLAQLPMLHQPGEAWLYNTCSDIQGVLVARVAGRPLPEFLSERIFQPLAMSDTSFHVPAEKRDRLPAYYGPDLTPIDDGIWTEPPIFPSGGGGLLSTLADWHRFGRMLLAGGRGLLSPESVRMMMTDHLTRQQRDAATLFLEGAGWGFGGAVGPDGRYGWVGGTGTAAHVAPSTSTVGILFTQVQMSGPTPPPLMRQFWQHAFGAP